jgi:hypothetical protein
VLLLRIPFGKICSFPQNGRRSNKWETGIPYYGKNNYAKAGNSLRPMRSTGKTANRKLLQPMELSYNQPLHQESRLLPKKPGQLFPPMANYVKPGFFVDVGTIGLWGGSLRNASS